MTAPATDPRPKQLSPALIDDACLVWAAARAEGRQRLRLSLGSDEAVETAPDPVDWRDITADERYALTHVLLWVLNTEPD